MTEPRKKSDILMLWVELDGASRAKLLQHFPPKHEAVTAHHMTVAFRPSSSQLEAFSPGEKVVLRVIGYAEDERGQAVLVSGFPSSNAHPHITISCGQGTKPVYSNELLANGFDRLDGTLSLNGTTVAITKKQQKIYDGAALV